MHSLGVIDWFISLVASIWLIFQMVGIHAMTSFFPEGHRYWHFPVQLGTLILFAVVVLNHPF